MENQTYDTAGEVTTDQFGNRYTYDAEGRIQYAGNALYNYDGDGNRVSKTVSGTTTLYWPTIVGISDESDSTGTNFGKQIYFAGLQIYSEDIAGNGKYLFQDHLGSTRITGDAANTVQDDIDYLPFGEITANYASGSDNHYLFTGDEADTESQTNYATFRNLDGLFSRFNRPDPYDGSYDWTNPQSFNRYAYVLNNPMVFTDPLGLSIIPAFWCNLLPFICNRASTDGQGDDGGGYGVSPYDGFYGGNGSMSSPFVVYAGGASGSGTGAPSSLLGKICGAVPSETVVSVSGNGNFVGTAGSLDLVTNGRTGEVTGFFSPGYFAGYTTAGASLTGGYTFGNLGSVNSNFSGGFTGVSGGWGFFVGSVATSSGGPANPLSITGGVTTVSAGVQTPGRGILASTTYSLPTQLGKVWTLAADPATAAVFAANQLCALAGH